MSCVYWTMPALTKHQYTPASAHQLQSDRPGLVCRQSTTTTHLAQMTEADRTMIELVND